MLWSLTWDTDLQKTDGTQWYSLCTEPPTPPLPSGVVHQTVNIKLEKLSTFASLRDLIIRNCFLTGAETAVWEFLYQPDWHEYRKWAGRIADFQFQEKILHRCRFSTFEHIKCCRQLHITSPLTSHCKISTLPPSALAYYFTLSPSLPSSP